MGIAIRIICISSLFLGDCSQHSQEQSHARVNPSAFQITDEFAIDTTLREKPVEPLGEPSYDSAAKPVYIQRPDYPPIASSSTAQADVWVKAVVDSNGNVPYAYVEKSDSLMLNKAALEAAIQWKFKPAVWKGKPVRSWVVLPFKFLVSVRNEGH
ncbi:MAG TPA: energy transducer TonB [Bacteroidota bacterium]|nr:energy transducer TonB [Bacteroidota bacterium]